MNAIHLYFILALLLSAGILFYYLSYRSVKQPRTDILFTDALNAMVRGDKSKAVRTLRQVVKQDSNHVRAYLQLGNILRDENTEQAIKIHQSLTVRPNLSSEMRVDIHRALANDYKKIGNYTKAKNEAEQILSIEKRNLWSLKFLIDVAIENQDSSNRVNLSDISALRELVLSANQFEPIGRVIGNFDNIDIILGPIFSEQANVIYEYAREKNIINNITCDFFSNSRGLWKMRLACQKKPENKKLKS